MAVMLPMAGVHEDVWIPTACDMCYNGCTIRVHRVDGVAVRVEGVPDAPPNYGRMCAKGQAALMNVYSPNRVTAPMIRTNPEKGIGVDPGWKEISWEEAMDLLVEKLRAARAKDPRSILGLTFDRYMFHVQTAFMTAIGSPNRTTGSAGFFCGRGTHPVAFMLTGSNDTHPDLHHTNYLLMFGTSYGFVAQANAMGLAAQMADARARGMKLTVVDPVLTYAASQADEWVPIRPGTDSAFALGLMREWVVELKQYDREFLRHYTNATYLVGDDGHYVRDPESGKPLVGVAATGAAMPFDAVPWQEMALDGSFSVAGRPASPSFVPFKAHLDLYTPEHVAEITTIPAATIRRIAREMVEAAEIGQTILIDGETLPLRPAVACWYRGLSAHKHGLKNGMSAGHLNVLLGAVDVPGGLLNASGAGPTWKPRAEQDGLIVVGSPYGSVQASSLPRRKVKPPETIELTELFPVAHSAGSSIALGLLRADDFELPYRCQVLIQARTNIMATSGDPVVMAEALKTIPFICSMNVFHDESSAFADLLLPDTHALERLVPLVYNPYYHYTSAAMPFEHYSWNFQQPVVRAVEKARHWGEVLFDAIGRLGLLPDFNTAFNAVARLPEPYRLERDVAYTWAEIADRWTKSICEDHGLDWFGEHGYFKSESVRGARLAYPRVFHEARIPLYLEHFIDAGDAVRAFTAPRDPEWDTADYTPLVDWKPCLDASDSPPGFDLWVVNQKLPFMTFSFSAENPLLVDLAKRNMKVYTVAINAATAARKGIADGDRIVLETPGGKRADGIARLTDGIHPDCVNVPGILGRWEIGNQDARGRGIHFNSLLTYSVRHMDGLSGALDACIKVKISRAEGTTARPD